MKPEESKESVPHALLSRLVGEWSGTTKTWFEPDVLADESPMIGTIRVALDGRFVVHEYTGSLQGKPFSGMAIYGFDPAEKKWQAAWVDSFHLSNAIMFSEGGAGDKFRATGSYFAGEGEPRWSWRTEIEQMDDDNIVITAFNIMPTGEEAKATETRYARTS